MEDYTYLKAQLIINALLKEAFKNVSQEMFRYSVETAPIFTGHLKNTADFTSSFAVTTDLVAQITYGGPSYGLPPIGSEETTDVNWAVGVEYGRESEAADQCEVSIPGYWRRNKNGSRTYVKPSKRVYKDNRPVKGLDGSIRYLNELGPENGNEWLTTSIQEVLRTTLAVPNGLTKFMPSTAVYV